MKICFFCNCEITGKSHLEHIFPDAFLGKHSLKNEKISLYGGKEVTYSRVKVDAHADCNNGFGSRYEQKILRLLENFDYYQNELEQIHIGIDIIQPPSDDVSALLTSWFIKLYFGMVWYEGNLKFHHDINYQNYLKNILRRHDFRLMQKAYKMGKGFGLPSSLYYFRLNDVPEMPFEQGLMHDPSVFWMKINEHFFMLSIGDGQLSYNYLNDARVNDIRIRFQSCLNDPFFFLLPLSHLIAVRKHLPKSPSFLIGENWVVNMSTMTSSSLSFDIDGDAVNSEVLKIHHDLLKRFGVTTRPNGSP